MQRQRQQKIEVGYENQQSTRRERKIKRRSGRARNLENLGKVAREMRLNWRKKASIRNKLKVNKKGNDKLVLGVALVRMPTGG